MITVKIHMKKHVQFFVGIFVGIVAVVTVAATHQSSDTPPFKSGAFYQFQFSRPGMADQSGEVVGVSGRWVKLQSQHGANARKHVRWINVEEVRVIIDHEARREANAE